MTENPDRLANTADLEEALADLRSRYDDLVVSSSEWLWETDEEHRITHLTDGIRQFNGNIDPACFLGVKRTAKMSVDHIDPQALQRHLDDLENRRPFRNFRYTHVDPNGGLHHWSVSGRPKYRADGSFAGYRGLGRDITERARMEIRLQELNEELQQEVRERRQAEEALRELTDELDHRVTERTAELNEANAALMQEIGERMRAEQALGQSRDQLRLVTDNLPVWISYTGADRRFRFVNKTVSEWLAKPAEKLVGRTVRETLGVPTEYRKVVQRIDRVLTGEQVSFVDEITYPDGNTRTVHLTYVPHFTDGSAVEGYFALAEDITETVRTERALQAAQKMETIGQLTGGIAHDFNNLLAVIGGKAELLEERLGDDKLLQANVRTTQRGAELTQRLLTFSRRQTLQPHPIDLCALIPDLVVMFGRTLGERIEVVTKLSDDLWPVMADPGELENALLNLAINARDAMPEGGQLEIECTNLRIDSPVEHFGEPLPAGEYACIRVRDSGTGMTDEVLHRAFEPFYTTKDVGQGSGLGLSMVYGFARQSGGNAMIESEPGRGTVVSLYLPRTNSVEPAKIDGKTDGAAYGNGQRLLVLEDEVDVRTLAVTMLSSLGYQVTEAADAKQAETRLEEPDGIDRILSDVVLPGGVSGPQFVAAARRRYPHLSAVFMTGYAAEDAGPDGLLDEDELILRKPFRRHELSAAIQKALKR